jgi:outer membrane protein insertion porin family
VLQAFDDFKISSIQIEGSAVVPVATIKSYLPISVGDHMTDTRAQDVIEALFNTHFFEDITLKRQANTLVITVVECPVIGFLHIEGNKTLKKDDLLKAFKEAGLAEGRLYQAVLLDKVQKDLERQFIAIGKYAARLQVSVEHLGDRRVGLSIKIHEGPDARIRSIRILGAKAFSQKVLQDQMRLHATGPLSFLTRDNRYTATRFDSDLEAVRQLYLDKGYLQMRIHSHQVALSVDKKYLDISISIDEGGVYRIGTVNFLGFWEWPLDALHSLITIKPKDIASRAKIMRAIKVLQERVGEDGYAFAKITPSIDLHDSDKTVRLGFRCEPGEKIVTRFIHFSGNTHTDEKVLRREMLQLEGAPLSTILMENSRARLNKTGFFSTVTIDPVTVDGHSDQVDLDVAVEEAHAGQIGGSMGYSTEEGLVFGFNLHHRNFLGSGNMASFNFHRSKSAINYAVSYENPYYTIDGVSRGFQLFYNQSELSKTAYVTSYVSDSQGGTVQYGFPLGPSTRFSLGYGVQQTKIKVGVLSATSVQLQNIMQAQHERRYDEGMLFGGWNYNGFDRFLFPTKGRHIQVDVNTSLLGSSHYYGMGIKYQRYHPFGGSGFVFYHQMQSAFGHGFGGEALPFYKHYHAGGSRSVRGFYEHSLGPKDSFGKAFGGNVLWTNTFAVILPSWFSEAELPPARLQFFIDMGQVWDTQAYVGVSGANGVRCSTGVSLTWLSPMGPLVFNLAKPLKKYMSSYTAANGLSYRILDKTEPFSFGIGTSF